uniref:Complement component c3a, duplicate 5 n=1 Tax=Lates calcarifer TaxID=8187 RepID=A0A4W6DX42_LATCA
ERKNLTLLLSIHYILCLPLFPLLCRKVMTAPNVLRIGTPENIFVECQDCTNDNDFTVEINHHVPPACLLYTACDSSYWFQIPTGDFSKIPNMKQYVYLQARFPDIELFKVVLVSFQFGYIFIQTDKTLYTPNSKVHYRIFGLTPRMNPVERDNETRTDASIDIDIVTPEGVISPRGPVSLKLGTHSGDYTLGKIVSTGLWKVVTRFHSNPQLSYSAEFEVKEYVLPSFEVKLVAKPFFYVDSPDLIVSIKATYLFGKGVDGSAFGVFGIEHEGQKKSFPSSLQRVPIVRGEGEVTLKREHITETFPNILDLVGSNIFVAVSVLTGSGSEMTEAELRNIQIVTSPYTIHFKHTPKYFKPGMSFDITVEVVKPDGSPAQGITVVLNSDEVQGLTAANGLARLSINTVESSNPLTITAKTNDPNISPERQASASMTALPYNTGSNSYIHIGVDAAQVELGDNLKINLNLQRQEEGQNEITYLILSRGQLVKHGRYRTRSQVLISMIIPITKEMLPSFRIIAYYHTTGNEVVSDSVWVDVKDSCMGSLKLESTRSDASYEPRKMFGLKVTGDPEATVGLVAVDKGVFVLNNKHRLTLKKIWDTVEKYDTGCTPGGGKNGISVFYDAGLLFESNTASGTAYRQEFKCPVPTRKKRAATTMMNVTTSLLSQYTDELQRDCCIDGMRDTPVSYTCEIRSEYISDGAACVEAFLHCCKEMESQRAERKEENLQLARSEDDDNSYMDSNEITSRTKFPESWLWSDITLPACPRQTPNCDSTSLVKNVPLQDSITTWQFTGISLSRTHGICVADPLEVIVRKDFFIDIRLPYSVVRGEQVEIKAVLHNFRDDPATVRVDLAETEHVCSAASKKSKYREEVRVGPQTTRFVPFVIIPTKEGTHRIGVKASVKDSELNDGIVKELHVVPEGLLIKLPQIVTLDPANKGVGGKQVEIINSGIPKKDFLPNTPTSTQISVTGEKCYDMWQIITSLANVISGTPMGNLIYQPSGCGEENMIHMTLPVIAVTYLDKSNMWDPVSIDRRDKALQHILTGYHNQVTHRKKDGSFAACLDHRGSTWLTAYVVKVFAMARQLVAVQSKEICDAVKFLILRAQQSDGSFREVGRLSHGEMTGDVRGTDSDASMTAFCLIRHAGSLPGSIDKASDVLFQFASPDLSHWPVPKGRVYTLEATAYALLALVKAKTFKEADPIVRWFNKQQRVNGGYGSTQATMIVYQAVAEYWASAKDPEYDLNVDILLPGRSKPDKYNINSNNHFATRTSKINDINQDVKVTATGAGEATVTIVSLYYALPIEKESDCQKFNLSVQLLPEKMDEEEKIYRLKIEVLYKDTEHDATMTVLDIGLLTGFSVNTKDLDLLSKGRARTIAKYKMNTKPVESERSSLIIYLDKVSHTRPEEITFRIHQKLKVGVLQPAAVSVYEYNNNPFKTHCVKFYHPERRGGQLLRLCRNDECICAEENCSKQKKGKVNDADRTAKACETTARSKIDFGKSLFCVSKRTSDVGPQGKLRTFLSFPHCREALDLRKGKNYLIMGASKDIHKDDQGQLHTYVLGERTWIEYWPTEAECKTKEHSATCTGINGMVEHYRVNGCSQ